MSIKNFTVGEENPASARGIIRTLLDGEQKLIQCSPYPLMSPLSAHLISHRSGGKEITLTQLLSGYLSVVVLVDSGEPYQVSLKVIT